MIRQITFCAILFCLSYNVLAFQDDYVWQQTYKKQLPLAQSGDAEAQYDVGEMYEKGNGVAKDPRAAFNWFRQSAEQGHTKAAYKLGYAYLEGNGINEDFEKARHWLTIAANKDYARAQYYLAQLYEEGKGIGANLNDALDWYKKSDSNGFSPAKEKIAEIEDVLAAKQKSRAAKKARSAPASTARPVAANYPSKKRTGLKQHLLSSEWQKRDKPVEYLPSGITQCKDTGSKIECVSSPLTRNIGVAQISYTTKAILHDIDDAGQFNVSYRNTVEQIKVTDEKFAQSGQEVPVQLGVQDKEHQLKCSLKSDNELICHKDKIRKVHITRVEKP